MMDDLQQNPGRVVLAVLLIGLGVLFLLSPSWDVGFLWPVFVIAPGLVFLFLAITGDKGMSSLAIPGTIITGTGLILFYQNSTGDWGSWTYVWALYPVFVGLGLMYMGMRTGSQGTLRAGRGLAFWGLVGFVVFWALFGGLSGLVWPLLLIGAGIYLLLQSGVIPNPFGGGGGHRDAPKTKFNSAEDDAPLFTGAPVVGGPRSYGPSDDDLRRRIDEALADDDLDDSDSDEIVI